MAAVTTGMLLISGMVFLVAVVVFIWALFKIIRNIQFIIQSLLINSMVGLIGVLLLSLIGINFPLTIGTICAVALFGIPAMGTILLLMFSGMI